MLHLANHMVLIFVGPQRVKGQAKGELDPNQVVAEHLCCDPRRHRARVPSRKSPMLHVGWWMLNLDSGCWMVDVGYLHT